MPYSDNDDLILLSEHHDPIDLIGTKKRTSRSKKSHYVDSVFSSEDERPKSKKKKVPQRARQKLKSSSANLISDSDDQLLTRKHDSRKRTQRINYREHQSDEYFVEEEESDDEEYEEDENDIADGKFDKGNTSTTSSFPTDEEQFQSAEEKPENKVVDKLVTNVNKSKELFDQKNFDELDDQTKLKRLQQLVEKSKLFSQIIADTLLENTLQKKKKEKEEQKSRKKEFSLDEDEDEANIVIPKHRRPHRKTKKNDFMSLYNESKDKKISKETKNTKQKLEQTQSSTRSQPKLITGAVMRDYQLEGLDWLVTLYENGLNGILADEMGLGKTLQSISLLAFLYEHGNKGPFLIACPLSTVGNWVKEIEKFAPSIPHLSYVGTKDVREQLRKKHFIKQKRQNIGIVVTSYEFIIKDIRYLNKFQWKFLIVDEGHRLKNINSKLIKELKKLHTTNRLLLTGTPLQNNLDELWSLLNFILPDIFQDIELFHQWFDFSQLKGSENSEVINAEIQKSLIDNLHTILKPFLLRRLKKIVVKSLPPKREYIVYNSLTERQTALYKAALHRELKPYLLKTGFYEYIEANDLSEYYPKNVLDMFFREHIISKQDKQIQVIELDTKSENKDTSARNRARLAKRRNVNYKDIGFQEFEGDLSYTDSEDFSMSSDSDDLIPGFKKHRKKKISSSKKPEELVEDEAETIEYDDGKLKGLYLSRIHENTNGRKTRGKTNEYLNYLKSTVQPAVVEQMNQINQKNQSNLFADILDHLNITSQEQAINNGNGKQTFVNDNALIENVVEKNMEVMNVRNKTEYVKDDKNQENKNVDENKEDVEDDEKKNNNIKVDEKKELTNDEKTKEEAKDEKGTTVQNYASAKDQMDRIKEEEGIVHEKNKKERDVAVKEVDADGPLEIHQNEDYEDEQIKPEYAAEGVESLFQIWRLINKEVDMKNLGNLMMQLRLICDSPYLFFFPWDNEDNIDARLIENSGKMQMLDQMTNHLFVKEKKEKHKILIFSQFTKMLDLLEDWIAFKKMKCCRIDGATSQDIREEMIQNFNNNDDYKIFLLSTRAGGLGINLVAADTVFLFDSDWNPQVDLQAMDRVHRIGQKRPVIIYRFATTNTAEQILLSRADSKRRLEKVVIQMGKFESLMKLAGETKPRAKAPKPVNAVAAELGDLLKENTFAGQDITDNTLDEEEIKELFDRREEAYKKTVCIMKHIELFESSTTEYDDA